MLLIFELSSADTAWLRLREENIFYPRTFYLFFFFIFALLVSDQRMRGKTSYIYKTIHVSVQVLKVPH